MEEHSTHSMSKDLKLGDEDLAAVSGGKATNDRFIARGQTSVYEGTLFDRKSIGYVKNGSVLTGVTCENASWYKVPIRQNFSKLQLFLPRLVINKMMDSYVFIMSGDLEPASK